MRQSLHREVVMIDDLTIAGRVPGLEEPSPEMMQLPTPPGLPRRWGAARPNGTFVSVSETGVVTMRLSVPRLLNGNPVNYPLVPITDVEHLGLARLRRELATGLRLASARPGELERRLPIENWPVIRCTFAVDLRVSDPLKCIQGCMGIRRSHSARFDCHGAQRISTAAWYSKPLAAKFYCKANELRAHKLARDDDRAALERLAVDAERVLRFEVTFRQVAGLRRLFGPQCVGGLLPSLAIVCDPRIDGWVLAREAARLRLYEPLAGGDRTMFSSHVRQVVGALLEEQRRLARHERTLGRRKTLTSERLNDLVATYFLAAAYNVAEVAQLKGKSVSSVREQISDLRALGVPPDASPFSTMAESVREIAEALRPHLPESFPPRLEDWTERSAFVLPPWRADADVDSGTENADPDDEPIEEHGGAAEINVDDLML